MKLGFDVTYVTTLRVVDQEEIVENSSNVGFTGNPLLTPSPELIYFKHIGGGGGA